MANQLHFKTVQKNNNKMKPLILKVNTPTQRSFASKLGMSFRIASMIIRKDLKFLKMLKFKGYKLLPKHISERKTNGRK